MTSTDSSKTIERQRFGLEGALAFKSTKLQGQYVTQRHDFEVNGINHNADVDTGYVELLHTLSGEKWADRYKDGAFGALKPNKNFDGDTMTGGAWELGFRASSFDAKDFDRSGLVGSSTATGLATNASGYTKARAYTTGVKFWANPNFRVMADYVYTDFKGLIGTTTPNLNGRLYDDESALLVRTQIMF
jgi:phosphate-selective porin